MKHYYALEGDTVHKFTCRDCRDSFVYGWLTNGEMAYPGKELTVKRGVRFSYQLSANQKSEAVSHAGNCPQYREAES